MARRTRIDWLLPILSVRSCFVFPSCPSVSFVEQIASRPLLDSVGGAHVRVKGGGIDDIAVTLLIHRAASEGAPPAAGPFEARVGGQPLSPFSFRGSQAVLALVALRRRGEDERGCLAGLLWPDGAPSQALHTLRNCLAAEIQHLPTSPRQLVRRVRKGPPLLGRPLWTHAVPFTRGAALRAGARRLRPAAYGASSTSSSLKRGR